MSEEISNTAEENTDEILGSSAAQVGNGHVDPQKYHFKEAFLYPGKDSKPINLKPVMAGLIIKEGLEFNSIVAQMGIIDTMDILERLSIQSGEKVKILIEQTPTKLEGEPDFNPQLKSDKKKIELELYISDITDYDKPNFGTSRFLLTLVSKGAYYNQLKVLNKSFNGNVSDCIKSILSEIKEDVKSISSESWNSNTGSPIKGIYPNLKPFSAINWLTLNAYDDSTPMCFFQTIKSPHNRLRSWEDMAKGDLYSTYNNIPFNDVIRLGGSQKGEVNVYDQQRTSIRRLKSELGISKFNESKKGSFSSTVEFVDISTKTWEDNLKWDYKKKEMMKLNEHEPVIEKEFDFFGENNSKTFHLSLNSNAFGKTGNYHIDSKDNIQPASGYLGLMDTITQRMRIPGDPDLIPGTKVELKLWKNSGKPMKDGESDDTKDEYDNYFSGKYIVKQIIHEFTPNNYFMDVELIKDSFTFELNPDGAGKKAGGIPSGGIS